MNEGYITLICTNLLTAAAAVLGWLKWHFELREKRGEKKAKEAAEAELSTIQRRSRLKSPFFFVSHATFNVLYFDGDKPGQQLCLTSRSGNLLCWLRKEVNPDIPAGSDVYLVVDNNGSNAYEISVTIDGVRTSFFNAKTGTDNDMLVIKYTFGTVPPGTDQSLKFTFTTEDGVQDTHTYRTIHGGFFLKRTDPA